MVLLFGLVFFRWPSLEFFLPSPSHAGLNTGQLNMEYGLGRLSQKFNSNKSLMFKHSSAAGARTSFRHGPKSTNLKQVLFSTFVFNTFWTWHTSR